MLGGITAHSTMPKAYFECGEHYCFVWGVRISVFVLVSVPGNAASSPCCDVVEWACSVLSI
jgi:hypothetical protein